MQTTASSGSERLTVWEHLDELKTRFFYVAIAFFGFSSLGYFGREVIVGVMLKPLGQPVYYSSPIGAFSLTFSVALTFGFLLTLPFILYQIFKFIEPALPSSDKLKISPYIVSSALLLVSGVAFAYFFSLPAALYFLNQFSTGDIQALVSANEYFTFLTTYLLAFGIIFQLPVVILLLNHVAQISIRRLQSSSKFVAIASLLIAAILTPTPDPINQLIMAGPMILLYEISVLLIWLANRSGHQKDIRSSPQISEEEARSLYETNQLNEAEGAYLSLCYRHPKSAQYYAKLGVIYIKLGRFQEAREVLTLAIERDPECASCYANLGISLFELKLPKLAEPAIQKALALKPNHPRYTQLLDHVRKS